MAKNQAMYKKPVKLPERPATIDRTIPASQREPSQIIARLERENTMLKVQVEHCELRANVCHEYATGLEDVLIGLGYKIDRPAPEAEGQPGQAPTSGAACAPSLLSVPTETASESEETVPEPA